jgi:hypothetical protein
MSANFYKSFISFGSLSRIRFFSTFSKLTGALGAAVEAADCDVAVMSLEAGR